MSKKSKLTLTICATLLLAFISNFANWDTLSWPGAVVAAGITLLIAGGGPLGHPRLMTFLSIPTNTLLYTIVILSAARIYRFVRK